MRLLTKYWIIFIVIFAAHNAEEVVGNLPEWARAHGVFNPFADHVAFMLAVIILIIAASGTAYILEHHKSRRSATVLQIFCWIMIVNALWHVGASFYRGSVMPGAISAVVVLLVFGWLVIQARKAQVR